MWYESTLFFYMGCCDWTADSNTGVFPEDRYLPFFTGGCNDILLSSQSQILRWLPSPDSFDDSTASWTAFVSTRESLLSLLPGATLMNVTHRSRRLLCRGLAWYATEHKEK